MSEKLKQILAELRRRFEQLYGERLVQMILYGSQARGDAEDGSDIDVLVVLQGPVDVGEEIRRTSEIVASLSLENTVVISRAVFEADRFRRGQGAFLRNIRNEGIPL